MNKPKEYTKPVTIKRSSGVKFYGENMQRADALAAQAPYHGDRSRLINDLIEQAWAKYQRKQAVTA